MHISPVIHRPAVTQDASPADPASPPSVSSHELLGEGRMLIIRHGAEVYRLQLTGQNKLLLTK